MRRFTIGAAAAGLWTLAAVLPVGAAMTVSPFAGAWHLNKDESKLVAGNPAPQDIIWEIKNYSTKGHNDYNKVQYSLTIIYPDGKGRVEGFNGAFDGKPYPVQGREEGATRSYTVLPDGSLKSEFISPKTNVTGSQTCSLSPDSKKMTCQGTAADAQGKPAQYTVVFDRLVSSAQAINKKK